MSDQTYFSRVRIERAGLDSRALHRILSGDAYADHALVWQLFPDNEAARRDFLFRAERDASGWPLFFVLSQREPRGVPGLLRVESKPFAPRIEAGDRLGFRLRANPTEATAEPMSDAQLAGYNARRAEKGRVAKPRRARRRFHDVLMAAKRRHPLPDDVEGESRLVQTEAIDHAAREWLAERLAKAGLRPLNSADRSADGHVPALTWSGYLQHRLVHRGRRIQFSSVDYEGLVEVLDPAALAGALRDGIGRAKAFGCGLLLVRRA